MHGNHLGPFPPGPSVACACCVVVYFEGHPGKTLPRAIRIGECTDRHPWVCVCVVADELSGRQRFLE